MQKTEHFNMTYYIALQAGLPVDMAEKIAWVNQMTDECKKPELYGIQTAVDIIGGNWDDRMIQRDVIVPFHFVPGDSPDWPWSVTENSLRAQALVEAAGTNPFRLGVALHVHQDTYTHRGFSGWCEERNSCFHWTSLWSAIIPNVGHADVKVLPDIADANWPDPRSGEQIDNRYRVVRAAQKTYALIRKAFGITQDYKWPEINGEIWNLVNMKYDQRKAALLKLTGGWRFSSGTKDMQKKYMPDFIKAASAHQAFALTTFKDLPVIE